MNLFENKPLDEYYRLLIWSNAVCLEVSQRDLRVNMHRIAIYGYSASFVLSEVMFKVFGCGVFGDL